MLEEYGREAFLKNPFNNVILFPDPHFTLYPAIKFLRTFFEQLVPAYCMDFCLWLFKKKPLFVKLQKKIAKAILILEFFTMKQWEFTNDNLLFLSKQLSAVDNKVNLFTMIKEKFFQNLFIK